MKILSLNVNNFAGPSSKPLPENYKINDKVNWDLWNKAVDKWRKENSTSILKNVIDIVDMSKDFDIIFLHEVDTNCESWNNLLRLMSEQYFLKPPNGFDLSKYSKGKCRKSISCMFIKKEIKYEYKDDNFLDLEKNIEIKIGDIHIIGLHMKYEINYWEQFIQKYESLKGEKLLIIGDLNVYDTDTKIRTKFDELLKKGAKDIWIKQGESNDTPTCNTKRRIDYALSTPKLYDEKTPHELILNYIRHNNISDHAGIAIVL